MPTICLSSSFWSLWKTIVSSIRFNNSGLNEFFNSSRIRFSIASWFCWTVFAPNPTDFSSRRATAPRFDVIMITVFLKSTFLPFESVKCPSSNTCNKILNTSGWAFSISSSKITAYGRWRIFSVNWPPSSKPTYPGGEPTKRLTECFSIYSDISILTSASCSPNIASAKVFANSVLPTPVGPKNKNEPIGRRGSFKPLLARRIERAIALTASDCPMTRLCSTDSKLIKRSLSFFSICWRGIPVHWETTSAISPSPIEAI